MKYVSIISLYFLLAVVACVFVSQSNGLFTSGDKKKTDGKGQCSLYKGRCGGSLTNTCCKAPYKCSKQTAICGKDKLCCVSEADIQRHKQETAGWLANRSGK